MKSVSFLEGYTNLPWQQELLPTVKGTRGGEAIKPGTLHGGEAIKPGTLH